MSLLDGHFAQGGKYFGELYILGALGIAAVALDASPEDRIGEDFLTQTEQNLANNLARIKLSVDLTNWASGGASSARKTGFDVLSAGPASELELEIRVKIFGF